MGTSNLISVGITLNDLRRAVQKLVSNKIGGGSSPTFGGLTLTGLTANRLISSNANKTLVSSDLYSWVTETSNQVLIADDGDGTVTFSTPQDIHTGASPTFAGLTLSAIANEATDVDKFLVDSTGVIKYRTGAEVLSDIGGSASSHLHDGATLQHNAVNSDGGAFSFTTTGLVTFNQSIASANYTAANLLTACATNAGALDFSAASKTLTVEDDAIVSQDYSADASPTFANLSLGTGELTAGSINRASGTLTLEIGGTAEISITSSAITLGGNLVIPDDGYIGSASDTDAIQINSTGNAAFTQIARGIFPTAGDDLATKEYVDLAIGSSFDLFLSDTDDGVVANTHVMYPMETGDAESTENSPLLSDGPDQLAFSWLSEVGVPETDTLREGVYDCHVHLKKNSGGATTTVYWKLSYVDANGSSNKTLVTTSETTGGITTSEEMYDIHAVVPSPVPTGVTKRLLFELYANIGTGQDVTLTITMEGGHDSHISFQVPSSIWQHHGDVLDDLNTLGVVASDGQFIVGTGGGAFAYESGATVRTSLGLGIGDTPEFTSLDIGSTTYAISSIQVTGSFAIKTSGDNSDYLYISTVSDVPVIGTNGTCDLKITSSSGEIDFDNENLTTTGTITSGVITQSGATLANTYQPVDAGLTSLAGLTYAAASFVKMTGANAFALRTIAETADDLEGTIDHNNLANTHGAIQPLDAGLTSLAGLTYVSDSFIKVTATDVYAIRTIAQTKSDLSLNLVENTALSSWAGTSSITTLGTIASGTWQGTTVAVNQGGTGQVTAQAAIDSLSAVSGATNEHVLTKDTATGNAKWKEAAGGGGSGQSDVDGTPTTIYSEYFTGTTDSDSQTAVAHGITSGLTKILHVSGAITTTSGSTYITATYRNIDATANRGFSMGFDGTNVYFSHVQTNQQGKLYVIKVDYIL